ncbi:MAG: M1 family metallopeptidase [Chloroflexi bacterium]|nr:M1 family metallopeptidase [Chloroflexota bacterium]
MATTTTPPLSCAPVHRPSVRVGLVSVLLALAVALGAAAVPSAAYGPTLPAYTIMAALDLDRGSVDVRERLHYRNQTGVVLDRVVFEVVPNAIGAFTLGAVTVDGEPRDALLDGSVLEVPFAAPLALDGSVDVELTFTVTPPARPDRLSATGRVVTLGNWLPVLSLHREDWDRRQYVDVGDAFTREVADFDLTLTTNRPTQVVATGQLVEQEGTRWRFVARSVRDVAVLASSEFVVRTATVGTTTLQAAGLDAARSEMYLTRGTQFLRWLGERLTPYPYPTLVIVDGDLPASFGGMEYPGLVILANRIPAGPPGGNLDSLVLHELTHQWFYSLVGNDQIGSPWLDEAMATYIAYRYYAEAEPNEAPAVYRQTIAGGGDGWVDSSVYDFVSDGPYFTTVYHGGARFLDGLYDRLGNDTFWALIREHVATHRDRLATPRAFLDRAQAATTENLNPLISQYFRYGAFQYPTPQNWTLTMPTDGWSDRTSLFVGADFPVTRVQVWLDQRLLADGPANSLTLDTSDVEAGEYVLLVRVWNHEDVVFERDRRVTVSQHAAAVHP